MIYCFDTSAVNRLHDEPDRAAMVKGLISTNTVRVTAVNVIEISGTGDVARRTSMLGLLKELADGCRPLSAPNVLLRTLAKAYAEGNGRPFITLTDEEEDIWVALNAPDSHNEASRQSVFQWKEGLEMPFRMSHVEARDAFQEFFADNNSLRPKQASELVRLFCQDERFLYETVAPLFQESTGDVLKKGELRQFFREIPQWPLYLSGWAYAMFERAIRSSGYGHRGKAGTVDLWCALYLPFCDRFITDDAEQRKALRFLNVYNPAKPRASVLRYERFRKYLLLP